MWGTCVWGTLGGALVWSANKCGTAAPLVLILALYLRPPSSDLLSRVSFLFSAVQRLWSWQRSQKVDDFTFCWQHYGIRRQLVGVAVKNGNVGHGKECNWINLRAFWYVRLCLSAICMYCVRSLSVCVLIDCAGFIVCFQYRQLRVFNSCTHQH